MPAKGSKKQFCNHGHNTLICGKDKTNWCNDCKKDWKNRVHKNLKQFCPKGHDTFIVGRYQYNGMCNQCRDEEHPGFIGHPKSQFCPQKHDKNAVGRYKDGSCMECGRIYRKEHKKPLKPKTSICKNGHDKNITGKYPNEQCKVCISERRKRNHILQHKIYPQFCERNHDTLITGRTKRGKCVVCQKINREQYLLLNKEKIKLQIKKRAERLKKELQEYREKYYQENKEIILVKCRVYRQSHKKERNLNEKERRVKDLNYKISCSLRTRLRQAIKGNQKTGSAVRDLGCSIEFLKNYIAAQFHDGMTWDNWGKVWQLDHIKALWRFDLTDREQFLKAVNYRNLQPLTIKEHKKKSAKEFIEWKTREK